MQFARSDWKAIDQSRRLQCIVDRSADCGAYGGQSAFAGTAHAERILWAGAILPQVHFDRRRLVARRHEIVGETGRERLPCFIVDELFEKGSADSLNRCAGYLTVHEHGVDGAANFVADDIPLDLHPTRIWIYPYLSDLDPVRIIGP